MTWIEYDGHREYDLVNGQIPKHIIWGNKGSKAWKYLTFGAGWTNGLVADYIDLISYSGMHPKLWKPFPDDSKQELMNKYYLLVYFSSHYPVFSDLVDLKHITKNIDVTYENVFRVWAFIYAFFYNDISVMGIMKCISNIVSQGEKDVIVFDKCNQYSELMGLLFGDYTDDEGRITNMVDTLDEPYDKFFESNLSDLFKLNYEDFQYIKFGEQIYSGMDKERWNKFIDVHGDHVKAWNLFPVLQLVSKAKLSREFEDKLPKWDVTIYIKKDKKYNVLYKNVLLEVLKYILPADIINYGIITY